MNPIPGNFTYVDVTHSNNGEPVLLLEAVPAVVRLSFGPLPNGGATPTGLKNDATLYYFKHQLDTAATATEVSFAGSTAQTFTALVAAIDTAIGAGAVVTTLEGGDIVITSATTGEDSKLVISAGTTGADLLSSVRYGQSVYLKANIAAKGHTSYLRWEKLDDYDQREMYRIMSVVAPNATDWSYATAGVLLDDANANVETTTALTGLLAATYDLNVTIDGVTKNVAFALGADPTVAGAFAAFEAAMAVAFPDATVAMVDGTGDVSFTVASPTPGVEGEAVVAAGTSKDFVAAVDALTGITDATAVIAQVDGAVGTPDGVPAGYSTWAAALFDEDAKELNGFSPLTSAGPAAFIEREYKPSAKGRAFNGGTYKYYGKDIAGNAADWRDYDTEADITP